jgi:hypothetical protein
MQRKHSLWFDNTCIGCGSRNQISLGGIHSFDICEHQCKLSSLTLVSLVQDLTNLGYRWPQLVNGDLKEQDETLPNIEDTATWEPIIPTLFKRLPDVTLIVMYNTPVPAAVPRIIQRIYQPVFGQVRLSLPHAVKRMNVLLLG